MAEFKLGRIRFVWKGTWSSGTTYYQDDVVTTGGRMYICTIGHDSSADFYSDFDIAPPKWNLVSDGQAWRGSWSPNTEYIYNDIVKYGSGLYICNTNHTSANTTGSGSFTVTIETNNQAPGNNVYVLDGEQYPSLQFIAGYTYTFNQDDASNDTHPLLFSETQHGIHNGGSEYTTGVTYYLDGAEVVDSTAYVAGFDAATTREVRIAVTGATPDPLYYYCHNHNNMAVDADIDISLVGLESDAEKWDTLTNGITWKGDWQTSFGYKINDLVKYGGTTYVCNTAHTSNGTFSSGLEADQDKWDYFNQGIEYKSNWITGTRYKVNDVVRYGASLWIATAYHTAGVTFGGDSANWEKFVEGFQYEGEWDAYADYQPGDIVQYGGYQYIAKTDHSGEFPSTSTANWDLFSEGFRFLDDWAADSSNQDYRVGDVVRYGGFTYLCIQDHNNQEPPNATYWKKFTSGLNWRGEWLDDQEYKDGDVIRYGDNSYICILGHVSEGDDYSSLGGAQNSRPDLDLSGTYWQVIAVGTEQSVLTTKGDLVYYSGSAPARLPIGEDGQILTVNAEGLPNWEFIGETDDVYYVAGHGKDNPAPIYGKTIDRPFKTIRYAAHQIERGAKNPAARELLELNRRFIQREIVEWVDYQVTNNIAPFTTSFDFYSAKCERDMGLIVDAMIWDITHGGNEYSWDAMYEYVKNASNFYTLGQEAETVAAINYGITVMTAVLNQQAPAANYQTLNGDNSTAIVAQYFNSNITAESVIDQITENVKIITDAITASNPNQTLPKKIVPTTLIRVATGYYYEVLPIIVPAQCCIMGDELRATNVQPRKSSNSTLTPRKDVPFSFEGLNRVGEIVGDIVEGVAVTATSGNIVTQDQSWPYAETDVVGPQVEKLTRVIQKQIDSSIGDKISAIYKPAYELADANYGYSRDLFLANKEFIKEEIIAYIADQYPNLYYSKTKCRQDVGLIMDNVAYDLTYGGTWMSIEAGKAYFNGASGTLQIDSTEKAATLAAYEYLKQLMQTTGRNITVNPTYQTPSVVGDVSTVPVPQISGTGGSAAVSTQIGTLMDIVIDIIDNGIGSAPSVTYPTIPANSDASDAKTTLDATKTSISTETIDFINENFGSFTYDSGKFRSDITNIVTDIAFDVALGTNYNAVFNGIAHNRPANAYGIADGKVQTIGALRYLRDDVVNEVTDTAAKTATNNAFNEIVDILDNGNGSADALSYPTPSTLPTTNADDAYANLNANKAFIEAEITAWIDDQVLENTTTNPDPNSIWFNFTYDATKCARDVGYIVEAEKYDILYGGTMASTRIAESYFGPTGTAYPAGQTEQTAAAYDRLATVLDEISREVLVTKSSGNAETQTQLGSPAGTTEGNALLANLQIIEDVLTAGNTDSLPAATYPDIAALSVSATLQTEKAAIDTARPQSVLDTIQYVSDTYNDFNYIHSKCSRDVGLIIDAFIYDYALETNYAGLFSAQSYLRAPSANVVKDQKTASIAAFEFARTKVIEDLLPTATGGPIPALQYVNQTWEWVDDTVFSATPEGGKSNADQEVWNAVRQLELNKEFIVEEVVAHIDNWFKVAVTRIDSATDVLTVSDTSWMQHNQEIVFQNLDDSTDAVTNAQLDTSTTYYVKDILSDTSLTISETPGGAAKNFTTDADYFAVNIESPKLRKDFYEIIEGALYDAVFNTNYNQVALGLDFVTGDNASATTIAKSAILAGLTYAKARVAEVAELRKNATLLSRTNAAFDEVSDIVNNGAGNADALSFATTTNASLQIAANESFIAGEVLEWLNQNYNAIYTAMDTGQFTTEIGYVCDALRYDLANGGNSATHRLAERYFTGTTFIDNLDNNRTAGNLAFNYLQSFIDNIVLDDSAGWTKLSGGTQDVSNGAGSATDATNAQALVGILENAAGDGDTSNFAEKTYPLSTEANGDVVNGVMNHAERIANRAIRYVDDTYTAMFELKANYSYDKTLCKRDVREYVEAMKWDLSYPQEWHREYTDGISFYRPAAYKTKLAARYYVNAVLGSQEEDFYYLRDGTGLRLQTLDGLQGDLGPTNTYGTRRPTAGAYASLDPGWGPGDKRAWITARSPYVQNCTTFGYAAIGQKIDGALHDGGNDSIVSNDFTQVISDGIGAWITNNGRAELVSVFTYYSHVGYLAENGGRIRATNGNNSYGTWGSVAEGTDPEETAITGVVDNKFQYNATIAVVNTDADEILNTEFSHAGNDYTEAAIDFFGPGANEVIVADEFRDGAVFQVRVGETPGVTTGGAGYLVVTNTAQAGTTTSITLSATDGNISTAYIGMRVQITGGAGVGLYGIIDTYNAGSKVATVTRESDGVAGWDHVVPGFVWEQPNSTSTYLIEPYVGFTDPTKASGASTLPTSTTWYANKFIETAAEYTNVATETESDGNGATFDVIRNGSRYYLTVNNAGTGYTRLDTVTIKGSNLGGVDTTHDVTVTLTSLNANGSIVDFDFIGNGRKGFFLAAGAGSNGAISYDGINWTAQNITAPGAGNWSEIAQGLLDDGSTTFHPSSIIIVGDGTNDIARSSDGDTWTAGALPGGMSSAGEKSIAFGNVSVGVNRYVVISDDDRDVAYTEDAGQNWTLTTNALSAVGFDSITFGKGLYVAVSSGTTSASYSDNGVTWTDVVLPGTVAGNITWGNGKFIVVGGTNGVMYSLDGVNWYDPELPGQGTGLTLPLTATERQVAYGQGVFVITSDDTDEVQYSQDGLYWQAYTLTGGAVTGGFNAVAFGNPEKAGVFSILPNASGTAARYANIGATARARAGTANEQIFEFRLYEPGSGYSSAPTITITDPNNTEDVTTVVRIGTGALANPTYVNRGSGYTSSTASLDTLNSNGSADFLQSGQYIAVRRLTERPVNGSNVEFAGQSGTFYKLVSTVSFIGTNDGSYTAFLQLSPEVTITDAPADGEAVEMRIRFSQVRLTGHDFLDIGTGNFADTNYPGIPVNNPDQTKETNDANGGRVFYTATDQDGNFRVGDLFSVEQATGVATLNAEAFNIAGLQELSLGEVTLGGNSASITEFSTDPFFTANSDSIVPTQRAIKAYIESQIGGGGATLVVNSVTAGDIFIGGQQITTVSGSPITIKANVIFSGTVLGYPLAWNYFQR